MIVLQEEPYVVDRPVYSDVIHNSKLNQASSVKRRRLLKPLSFV